MPEPLADHRRRQHEGGDRRRPSTRRSPAAATGRGSSAAIRWPATIAPAPSMPAAICSRAARSSSRRPNDTRPAAVTEVSGFWQSLGAEVVDDDARPSTTRRWRRRAICRTWSPSALAAATPTELLPLAASGWRDTTRIAGGDPELWRAIFATNRQDVLDALERFERWTGEIREMSGTRADDERLLRILERAKWMKANRDALGD